MLTSIGTSSSWRREGSEELVKPLIVTYHSIGEGPRPLCIEPELFSHHVARFAAHGLTVLTVSELADRLRRGDLPDRSLAITFDDGFADTVEVAAPILRTHGFRATVFCISDFVGRTNDWPSQPASAPRLPLASVADLRVLVDDGWEIGAHTVDHPSLDTLADPELERQLRSSRNALQDMLSVSVSSFAYPYGHAVGAAEPHLEAAGYRAACTSRAARVGVDDCPYRLPRLDAHYVRSPALLDLALSRRLGVGYLTARRVGARARRLVR